MPIGLHNLEWLGLNSQRSYPLSEEASRTDESGTFQIPNSLILALVFPVHAGLTVEAERFFIRSVTVFATGVSIALAYDDATASPPTIAAAVAPFSGHTEYQSYTLAGTGNYADCVGRIVLGNLDDLNALPAGHYYFTGAAGRLDSDCVRPQIRGVSSLVLVSAGEATDRLQGDVTLVAGTNVRFTVSGGADAYSVRIDAIDGEGLTDDCECAGDSELPCIQTINQVGPDGDGNLNLLGDDCLTVTPATHGLQLADVCSKPCCGCEELEAVTRDLERFGDGATALNNYVTRLEGAVHRMEITVLGSRLNDRGCRT